MMEAQQAEYEKRERESLARGRCPDSGMKLVRHPDGHRYCEAVCDCFGYSEEEFRAKGGRDV